VLPFLDACPDSVTVSGISAGGHYSNHLQIVLSDVIKGAGISSAGPFMMGMGQLRNWEAERMVEQSLLKIEEL